MSGRHGGGVTRVHTSDPEKAMQSVVDAFSDHRLEVRDSATLDLDLALAQGVRVVTGTMSYGTEVRLSGPPIGFAYHLNIPEVGESTVRQRGASKSFRAGTAGVIFGPEDPVSIEWSADNRQYHVQIPAADLEAHATKVFGRAVESRIDFDLTFELTGPAGRSLASTVRFMVDQLATPGGLGELPAACAELESSFMSQLLLTVPNRCLAQATVPRGSGRDALVRSATDYIEANLGSELTAAGVAVEMRVSERTLQAAFRERLGLSPTAFIRGARLDRARLDLMRGDSVSQAAARWGFHHAGRFAQLYRERFGVRPSDAGIG